MSNEEAMATFQVGDVVRHKGSHRLGVISGIQTQCVKHNVWDMCFMCVDRSECDIRPSGTYEVSIDWDRTISHVPWYEMELIAYNDRECGK
jgi:hypothetical protein